MIEFTQGDTALLTFIATDGNGNPVDITGATLTTSFLGLQGNSILFPNSQHTVNPDQANFRGQFLLALTVLNTQSVPVGDNKEVVSKIVVGGSTLYYHGTGDNGVNVLSATPRQ